MARSTGKPTCAVQGWQVSRWLWESNIRVHLAFRIRTYEYPLCALLAVYFLAATGHMPGKFPTDEWIKAVQWHGDLKVVAIINTEAEWADATTLLAPLENVVVEAESKQGVVVWSSAQKDPPAIPTDSFLLQLAVLTGDDIQRHLPETLHVEATGLIQVSFFFWRCTASWTAKLPLPRKITSHPSYSSTIKPSKSRMLAGALLRVASNPTPSPFLPTHRCGRTKIVSHRPSNSRCLRPPCRSCSPVFRRSKRVRMIVATSSSRQSPNGSSVHTYLSH